MKVLIVSLLLVTAAVVWAEYPANLPRCAFADSACILKVGQEYITKHYSGINELNLLPFDPLHVKSMVLERNPSSPVNIEFKFSNLDFIGMKSMNLINIKGFAKDKGGRNEFEAIIPELTLKGKYTVDGRVLVLPVVGDGDTEIKCDKVHFKYSFDFKPLEKNGKTYATMEHVKLEVDPELVHFHFDNLFNGDKALGDNVNNFVNENWKDIFEEIKPSFSKALSLVVKSTLNKFFESTPYEEFFLPKEN